jgi:hypothetical protein
MMFCMQNFFSIAREVSHSLLAVLGAVAGGQAAIATIAAEFGLHISALDISQKAGAVGVVVLAVSKFIDSQNNAKVVAATVAVSGRPPV